MFYKSLDDAIEDSPFLECLHTLEEDDDIDNNDEPMEMEEDDPNWEMPLPTPSTSADIITRYGTFILVVFCLALLVVNFIFCGSDFDLSNSNMHSCLWVEIAN